MNDGQSLQWWRTYAAPSGAEMGAPTVPVKRGGETPFWGLIAFTFILMLAPQALLPALQPLHIAFLSAALAGGAYVFERFIHHEPVFKPAPAVLIAAILAAWAAITVPLSYWPGGSLSYLMDVYFKSLVVFWLLASVIDSTPRLKIVAWALSLMAIPLALSGVKHFFTGGFASQEATHGLERITGYDAPLTQNPNDLALMLDLILPLSLALLLASRRPAARLLLLGTVCLSALAIVASFSRAGFLTLGVIAVIYLWILLRRRQQGLAIIALLLMAASLPLMPSGYIERLGTITDIQADTTGSAQARLQDTEAAIGFTASHPLIGAGIGNNILALNEARGATWKEVHNVYLVYGVELGVPGLFLFLLLLWECLRSVARAKRLAAAAGRDEVHLLATGIGVSLAAFAVAAFFYPDAYQFYFYYLAGLAVASRAVAEGAEGVSTGLPAEA